MKIKTSLLFDLVSIEKRHGLPFGTIVRIVHKGYCGRMEVRDLCTEKCENCQARLLNAFEIRGVPRNTTSLLVWRMKNAVAAAEEAKLADKDTKKPEPTRTRLGEVVPTSEVNPFETLLNNL